MFVSPSDNIQETFGLAVLEAMASGLPVVASDWDGYRDLVEHGKTGFLVPTAMVAASTSTVTARLLIGDLDYDHFLAECSQATTVDSRAMAAALEKLLDEPELRRRMGAAGRDRALKLFAWRSVIRSFEELWLSQESERSALCVLRPRLLDGSEVKDQPPIHLPKQTFAGYPSRRLDAYDRLMPAPGNSDRLDILLAMPLTHHAPGRRVANTELLQGALALAPCSIEDLDRFWSDHGVEHGLGRSTVAWMLKYDLLRADFNDSRPGGSLDEKNPV